MADDKVATEKVAEVEQPVANTSANDAQNLQELSNLVKDSPTKDTDEKDWSPKRLTQRNRKKGMHYCVTHANECEKAMIGVESFSDQIQSVLQQTQDRFQTMSDQVVKRIDEMSNRIDELETNINELMVQAGVQPDQAPPAVQQ